MMRFARCFRASLRPPQQSTALPFEAPLLFLNTTTPPIRGFASTSNIWPQKRLLVRQRSAESRRAGLGPAVRELHSSIGRRQRAGEASCSPAAPEVVREPSSKAVEAALEPLEPLEPLDPLAPPEPVRLLPVQCTGCGALSQTSDPHRAGYFRLDRKDVRTYLEGLGSSHENAGSGSGGKETDRIVEGALRGLDPERLSELGLDIKSLAGSTSDADVGNHASKPTTPFERMPLCDRCHRLVHHSEGESIYHPSMEAIQETIQESPYKYNHVYHVIDAADFPMSLLPQITKLLDMMPLRSRNRRAKMGRFYGDRKTEISFIITRSDLLGRKKEDVDRLMPYLTETLRDALGRTVRNARLGNVRCVSSKRNWWTTALKDDIWRRGGAGWMVGKVNVGKSQLFEAVFPKGRMEATPPSKHQIEVALQPRKDEGGQAMLGRHGIEDDSEKDLDAYSLLPPARPETNYPDMPVVSSLPGTTASPIRVPFGGGKGELIDLPGLERSSLDLFVRPEHRASLLMKSRISPEQQVMRPWSSLLLGGFIRITPRVPASSDLIFLAYAFTPIKVHLTRTEKAIEIQEQTSDRNVENISLPDTGAKIAHAGSFPLRWDVTKARTGPITRHDAVNMKVDQLPYRVLATDILIEGCGWVEIVAQVRTKDLFRQPQPKRQDGNEWWQQDAGSSTATQGEPNWPVVDVFSPEGRFIAARPPMNAWQMNKPKKLSGGRPKKSMKGAKKLAKAARRATTAS